VPLLTGGHSRSAGQYIFFFLSSLPHQWSAIDRQIFSRVATGIWKQLITYVGIAWIIDLNIGSFPDRERGWPDQLLTLLGS
jgi:hypothetical protein